MFEIFLYIIIKFLYAVYTNMNFYHPSSLYLISLAQAHLPHHDKQFCTRKRRICFGHLGVITLSEGQDPGSDKISILVAVSIENRFNVKNDNKHFASQIL